MLMQFNNFLSKAQMKQKSKIS